MNDHDTLFGKRPLSTFYDVLSREQAVKMAIGEAFGSKAQDVLNGMRDGHVPPDHEDELNDALLDLLGEKGETAVEFVGRGDFDEFPITVRKFGPIFWIEATEFDDIGYFDNLVVAHETATSNYEPFITHAAEKSKQDD